MMNWQRFSNPLAASPKLITLPKNTTLYHGTGYAGRFFPEGPAWFTPDEDEASVWADGHAERLRDAGERAYPHVLVFVTTAEVPLLFAESLEEAAEISDQLAGGRFLIAADQVCASGQVGWWVRVDRRHTDVMICEPEQWLKLSRRKGR